MQNLIILFTLVILSAVFGGVNTAPAFAEQPPLKGNAKDFLSWCSNPKEDCQDLLVMHRATYSEFGKGREGLPQICVPNPIAGSELKSTVIRELNNDDILQSMSTTPALLKIYEKHYPCK